jgi:SulP family sulfate permease
MLATVITVIGTHNLALGVGVGVLLSGIFFAWKVSQIFRVTSTLTADGKERDYLIEGQLFFASAEHFLDSFDFAEKLERVRVDLTHAHIWDLTGVNAVDKVVLKFRRAGAEVEVLGLNDASATIMDELAMHDEPNAMAKVLGH